MLPAPSTPFDYTALPTATATSLRKQAAKIREGVKATTAAIIEVGRDLIAVKQKLEHGQFSEWILAECGFTIRTAENYIRAAEFAEGKNETISLLPPATLYKLSAKSAPPEIVQAVIDRVESGVRVTSGDVDAALTEARFQRREEDRKQKEATRRKAVSKRTLAKREAKRGKYEAEEQKRQEGLRVVALSIIDTIGEDHAQFLVGALALNCFEIFEHLRREVRNLGADQPRTKGAEGIAQEIEAMAAAEPKSKRNGSDDYTTPDMGELGADRWTETH